MAVVSLMTPLRASRIAARSLLQRTTAARDDRLDTELPYQLAQALAEVGQAA